MKRTILFLAIFFSILHSKAQPYFNRIYRLDPHQGNATAFFSLRVINNAIYTAGIGVFNVTDTTVSNSGIFTSFDMSGNLIKNTYYGEIPTNSDFVDDVILPEPNNQFSLVGYNFEGTFSFFKVNSNGNIVFNKKYSPPTDTITYFESPTSIIKTKFGYVITPFHVVGRTVKAMVFMTDLNGNHLRTIEFFEDQRYNAPTQVIENKNKNLTLSLFKTDHRDTDTDYVYISQLREIDTLGNTFWVYNTPRDRFIYIKKFVQLANGNYLVWGDEELSKNVFGGTYWYRSAYDVGPYLAEINSQKGVVWEKRFDLGTGSRIYGLKILKDSSIALTCFYNDGPNNASACLIKLNNRYDSLFRRNFRPTSITSNKLIPYPNQIEELPNGDLLIGGYVWDLAPLSRSPTSGQWGWLVRTDSLGCSLQPSSCRVPTKDIADTPLSIKAYPNPVFDQLNIDYAFVEKPNNTYLNIVDILGRSLFYQKIDALKGQIQWQTEAVPSGLYIIKVQSDNQVLWQSKVSVLK